MVIDVETCGSALRLLSGVEKKYGVDAVFGTTSMTVSNDVPLLMLFMAWMRAAALLTTVAGTIRDSSRFARRIVPAVLPPRRRRARLRSSIGWIPVGPAGLIRPIAASASLSANFMPYAQVPQSERS